MTSKFLNIAILTSLLTSWVHAAVLKESSVTIGHTTVQTLILREHQVKSSKGFSLLRMENNRIVGAKIISAKQYQEQIKDLDLIFTKKLKEKSAALAYCDQSIELGQWRKGQAAKKDRYCFNPVSEDTKQNFKSWWSKTAHL